MSLAKPRQNLALPHAIQQRVDAMFADATGFSGRELVSYFARLDSSVEQYPQSGGAPSRKQMLQDCLSRFGREQQLDILLDMMRPENYSAYSPPSAEDCQFLRDWIASQKNQGRAPVGARVPQAPSQTAGQSWDVFISHASEDKVTFAAPLAEALQGHGLRVWFDGFTLTVGDSLRRSIDRGLAQSRFGVVVLSEAFFRKHWPQLELDGLVARESAGVKVILPVWHDIDEERVRFYSPLLADRVAVPSTKGLPYVVSELLRVLRPGKL